MTDVKNDEVKRAPLMEMDDQEMVERMIDMSGAAIAQYGATKMDITQRETSGHTPEFNQRFGLKTA